MEVFTRNQQGMSFKTEKETTLIATFRKSLRKYQWKGFLPAPKMNSNTENCAKLEDDFLS